MNKRKDKRTHCEELGGCAGKEQGRKLQANLAWTAEGSLDAISQMKNSRFLSFLLKQSIKSFCNACYSL